MPDIPGGMMILIFTAASVGFFHTLIGPDHYVPFAVMARARNWSMAMTSWVTVLCGIGHIASSVLLGLVGVALGIAVTKLEGLQSFRGEPGRVVSTLLGLLDFVWGLRRGMRNRPHKHLHFHAKDGLHNHTHVHQGGARPRTCRRGGEAYALDTFYGLHFRPCVNRSSRFSCTLRPRGAISGWPG